MTFKQWMETVKDATTVNIASPNPGSVMGQQKSMVGGVNVAPSPDAMSPAKEESEPSEEDWQFYNTTINQGQIRKYLDYLTGALQGRPMTLYKKGFIVQEVLQSLGLSIQQAARVMQNIKRAEMKKSQETEKPHSVMNI